MVAVALRLILLELRKRPSDGPAQRGEGFSQQLCRVGFGGNIPRPFRVQLEAKTCSQLFDVFASVASPELPHQRGSVLGASSVSERCELGNEMGGGELANLPTTELGDLEHAGMEGFVGCQHEKANLDERTLPSLGRACQVQEQPEEFTVDIHNGYHRCSGVRVQGSLRMGGCTFDESALATRPVSCLR